MWLLNVDTVTLEPVDDDRRIVGQYAILSHTWGDDEVSFEALHHESSKSKSGYKKILNTCRQAARDGLRYAWVDTCCIDKRSSSELTEAINSMYRWYYNARVCYAYLSDLTTAGPKPSMASLKPCRWFTRGWTLQELIAPPLLVFYSEDWTPLASRKDLAEELAAITHVDQKVLVDREQLWQTSVAKRMSWASTRVTTREEDLAYSLLGIFHINMPLLYGEGDKAFRRLQEEIIRTWIRVDHSILAWHGPTSGLLADSPTQFLVHFPQNSSMYRDPDGRIVRRDIISWSSLQNESFELTNKGLRITLYAYALGGDQKPSDDAVRPLQDRAARLDLGAQHSQRLLVALNCTYSSSTDKLVAMYLRRRPWVHYGPHQPTSANTHDYAMYDFEPQYATILASQLNLFSRVTLTIAREYFQWPPAMTVRYDVQSARYAVLDATPSHRWQRQGELLAVTEDLRRAADNKDDPTCLVLGSQVVAGNAPDDASAAPPPLGLYTRFQWSGRFPALAVGLGGVGRARHVRLERLHSGEEKMLGVLAVKAESFFMADRLVWELAINDGQAKDAP